MSDSHVPTNIDEYIRALPPEVGAILQRIRSIVIEAAPGAKEKISYRIPAFTLDGDLLYFAAFRAHIGIYPPVTGDEKLRRDTARYRGEKGNLKFPLDEPMPYELIRRIVEFRLKEHRHKARSKGAQK